MGGIFHSLLSTTTGTAPIPTPSLITTVGYGTYTVPAGTTSLKVEAWGAGGGSMGDDNNFGASSGGAYATSNISVTSGQTIYYFVGTGGTGGQISATAGGISWVNRSSNAVPTSSSDGAKAAGGSGAPIASPNNNTQRANSIGTTINIGGAGGTGAEGGGGGAAGPNGDGVNGVSSGGGAGGAGNNGSGGAGGAAGVTTRDGGDGISNVTGGGGGGGSYNNVGGQGGAPGGAGGTGYTNTHVAPISGVNTNTRGYGGDGGRGQIKFTPS